MLPRLLLTAAFLLGGCTSIIPAQRASTVPKGTFRLSGEVATAPYCSLTTAPHVHCVAAGAPSLAPQLRVSGRHGLSDRADVGVSAHLLPVLGPGLRGGVLVDGKHELWSRPSSSGRQLLSAALAIGMTAGPPATTGRPGVTQLELAVPLFFGHQLQTVELVASPRLVERIAFVDLDQDGRREALGITELGLALGVHGRGALSWSLQLSYSAPISQLAGGPILLSLGVAYDLPTGPAPSPAVEEPELR